MTEAELIAAARLGDEEAFAELYGLHARYVKAIGRAMLRTGDVDDMCQDTFLLAFTRLAGFAEEAKFRSWITRIAINQCLNILRAKSQPSNGEAVLIQIDEQMEEEEGRHECFFASRDRALEAVPARLDLNKLLARLPARQRRVLEMAYLEDIPDLEIAAELGISLTCLKTRLNRAKRQAGGKK